MVTFLAKEFLTGRWNLKNDRGETRRVFKTIFLLLLPFWVIGCKESMQQQKLRVVKNRVDSCIDSESKESNEEVKKLIASACRTLEIDLNKLKEQK